MYFPIDISFPSMTSSSLNLLSYAEAW